MNEGCVSEFERRLKADLSGDAPAIPVLLGLCGCGRTTALRRVQHDLGADRCQYVDVERSATTPERFLQALRCSSPFVAAEPRSDQSPSGAFEAVLSFLCKARCRDGRPATFLLDEVLEFRTFESFPRLRNALPELLSALAATPNRFALASRFVSRSERAIHGAPAPFVVSEMDALSAEAVSRLLEEAGPHRLDWPDGREDGGDCGRARRAGLVGRLCEGRPAFVRAVAETMA
ncbi:MAG: hypothetical protein EHM24_27775, partial [Acidobacteria bacterium]